MLRLVVAFARAVSAVRASCSILELYEVANPTAPGSLISSLNLLTREGHVQLIGHYLTYSYSRILTQDNIGIALRCLQDFIQMCQNSFVPGLVLIYPRFRDFAYPMKDG